VCGVVSTGPVTASWEVAGERQARREVQRALVAEQWRRRRRRRRGVRGGISTAFEARAAPEQVAAGRAHLDSVDAGVLIAHEILLLELLVAAAEVGWATLDAYGGGCLRLFHVCALADIAEGEEERRRGGVQRRA